MFEFCINAELQKLKWVGTDTRGQVYPRKVSSANRLFFLAPTVFILTPKGWPEGSAKRCRNWNQIGKRGATLETETSVLAAAEFVLHWSQVGKYGRNVASQASITNEGWENTINREKKAFFPSEKWEIIGWAAKEKRKSKSSVSLCVVCFCYQQPSSSLLNIWTASRRWPWDTPISFLPLNTSGNQSGTSLVCVCACVG